MKYMNDYDIVSALSRYSVSATPRRLALAQVIDRLADWANHNSDGWCYWPKPCRSAAKAITLVESTAYPEHQRRQEEDATIAEFKAALSPIKAFLTRQGVPTDERADILEPANNPNLLEA